MAGGIPNSQMTNIYKAPNKHWDSWKTETRDLFNFAMNQGLNSRSAMCGGSDDLVDSEELNQLMNTFTFNLAFMVADRANKLIQTDAN